MNIIQAITQELDYIDVIKQTNTLEVDCPIRAVGYSRVSTEMQPQSALKSQEAVVKEFAGNVGMEVVKVFSDRGISGTTDERPQFQEMMKYVSDSKNNIQAIIVYKLDRFFRNEQLHHVYEYNLNKRGIFVFSATENVNSFDKGKRVIKAFTLILNEEEAIKIRQNVRRGQAYTAKQGKTNGGIAPLGYDINSEGKYIINQDEAEIVKQLFTMRSHGISYVEMAKRLNNQHYTTKVGRKFTKNSFHEILTNPKYKGVFTYNRSSSVDEPGKRPNRHKYKNKDEIIEVPGQIEAIVSEELWNSVQPTKKINRKKNTGKYLLSGIVKCPICGKVYQVDTKNDIKYLRHCKGKTDKCRNSIQMDEAAKKVIRSISNRLYSSKNIDYLLNNFSKISKKESAKISNKIKKLNSRIKTYQAKIDNYIESLSDINDKETRVAVENKITKTRKMIADFKGEISQMKSEIPQKPTKEEVIKSKARFRRYMLNPQNISQAKQLIHNMVEVVYIHDDKIEVKFK
ncbi:MAG: recombinase family protein [Oscillospiraceae bacterium]|nr:recombinase family protein [Oscillospiraceae bacterium]